MTLEENSANSLRSLLKSAGIEFDSEQEAVDFCSDYMSRLLRLVDSNLSKQFARRVAPEDVVQSAIRTWIRRTQEGKFAIQGDDELWKLLCTISLNKVRKSVAKHSAQRRDVRKVVHSDELIALALEPSAEQAVEFTETLELLNGQLTEVERQVLELMTAGESNKEIAVHLDLSTRTISRYKLRFAEILRQYIDVPNTDDLAEE